MDIDLNPTFKRSVMKLANTYRPGFSLDNNNFENEEELSKEFAKLVCDDFSKQLCAIFEKDLVELIRQEYLSSH
ncbi:hypothetical protein [Anaerococcus sp. AGMB09787]|uniref:hypothetical protein n=1 Tax=Anaerococcus sp. AGMB09787 TaxID=2922869 RepID=UPI001FAF19F8|nr:hypothetical protein [Anaerococcus sp. AGMB09787]